MPGRLRGEVELRDVGFSYAGADRPALDGVSLRVAPGETVALVGRDGSGQVDAGQAARAVLRRGPRRGARRRGRRARYRLAGFRQRLGVVPQEAHLFTGDVASNIAYGRPDATPAEIEAAARAVGALELVGPAAAGLPHARSASAGRGCRRGSASSSRWPAPSSSPRTCCSSTRRRPRSTPRPRPRCSRRATA